MPLAAGSWQIARRLMSGYEFADPSIVRAYYDPTIPLERRNMLLRLQAFGVVRFFVGVRVGEVYERTREVGGKHARVWGWNYRTLEGHVEIGQMDWEVWKWLDDGHVELHPHQFTPCRAPLRFRTQSFGSGSTCCATREREAFLTTAPNAGCASFTELAFADEGLRTAQSATPPPQFPHDGCAVQMPRTTPLRTGPREVTRHDAAAAVPRSSSFRTRR